MKVKYIKTGEVAVVDGSYGIRLIEQGVAVAAPEATHAVAPAKAQEKKAEAKSAGGK